MTDLKALTIRELLHDLDATTPPPLQTIHNWLQAGGIVAGSTPVLGSELYLAYAQWCTDNSAISLINSEWGREMSRCFVHKRHTKGTRYWVERGVFVNY